MQYENQVPRRQCRRQIAARETPRRARNTVSASHSPWLPSVGTVNSVRANPAAATAMLDLAADLLS